MAAELRLIARRLTDPDNVRAILARAQKLEAEAVEMRQRFNRPAMRDT